MQSQYPHMQTPLMGDPPPPGALQRVLRLARGTTLLTIALSSVIVALQFVMPEGNKPGEWIGSFHGSIEAADATTKKDALVELARRQAEEVAREQAKVQWEMEVLRQQMQTLYDS